MSLILFVATIEGVTAFGEIDLSYQAPAFSLHPDIGFPQVYQKCCRQFWRLRPDMTVHSRAYEGLVYTINGQGRRGPLVSDEKRCYRIVALGNSCTFGWGVADDETWPQNLENILNNRSWNGCVSVINGGIPGYSSFQGKRFFEDELIRLSPDLVLIMFGWNDHRQAKNGIRDSEQPMKFPAIVYLQNQLSRLRFYRFLRKTLLPLIEKRNAKPESYTSGVRRVTRDEFFDNLRQIIRTARRYNTRPVLLIPPVASSDNYFNGMPTELGLIHSTYQKEIVRVGQYNKVDVIDLQKVFDERSDLFDDAYSDAMHFNARSHTLAAEVIADFLITPVAAK